MGNMVACQMEGTFLTKMTWSKVVDSWIHLTGEVVVMGSTLVRVQKGIMDIITIILTGGVRGGTFHMISRNPYLLCLMER